MSTHFKVLLLPQEQCQVPDVVLEIGTCVAAEIPGAAAPYLAWERGHARRLSWEAVLQASWARIRHVLVMSGTRCMRAHSLVSSTLRRQSYLRLPLPGHLVCRAAPHSLSCAVLSAVQRWLSWRGRRWMHRQLWSWIMVLRALIL